MNFRSKQKEEIEPNITSLIDVVFLLLIFFMVTATFTRETQIKVDLPSAESSNKAVTAQMVEVSVDKEGNFYVNANSVGTNVDLLRQEIRKQSNNDNTIPFIISADADSPHKAVVLVLDTAGKLGFNRVSISAKQQSG